MPVLRPAPAKDRVPNHLTTLSLSAVIRDPGLCQHLTETPSCEALEFRLERDRVPIQCYWSESSDPFGEQRTGTRRDKSPGGLKHGGCCSDGTSHCPALLLCLRCGHGNRSLRPAISRSIRWRQTLVVHVAAWNGPAPDRP